MTDSEEAKYTNAVKSLLRERNIVECAVGFLRYEALRKLNSRQYSELSKRNRSGQRFDDMVDDLVLKGIT